jgi:YegS/Rv2252/BmrU family lipid kinase
LEKAMLIVNPSSGKEEAEACLDDVKEALIERDCEIVIRQTEKENDATRFAKEACHKGYDVVVSMGGDGTLNETINGISGEEHRPSLGIIPLGTVNDFARALHIPLETPEAIKVLSSKKTKAVDIGKVNEDYFMNIVAVGDIATASFTVSPKQKTLLGPLAYFLEGVKSVTGKTTINTKLHHDKGIWEGEVLLILAALTNSVGGFEKIAPEAEVNDGMIHCMAIKDVPLPKLAALMTSIFKGEHLESPAVEYIQTSKLKIEADRELTANIDGDEGDRLPITVEVLKKHIHVIVQEN